MTDTTHFGFQTVAESEKTAKVAGVFDSVAPRYDLMNDLMSAGMHRLWKRFAVDIAAVKPGERVLDLAGGSGDLSSRFARKIGARGELWLTDINNAMLTRGRGRLLDEGLVVPVAQCDAERLPFAANRFDCVSIAFGLRNLTRKEQGLREMLRVLRPGGRVIVLEFSKIWQPLQPLYDTYSFQVLPRLGKLVAQDADSYRYLAESIRMHPAQEDLKQLMESAGFERVDYFNLSAGVVAVHKGYKF
ncbi:MAG: bifunctional demethylmenaquinone methyltransferase/2-methoxy-6-polyprenyl-1,4-benzoquinol methylase UbiE [Burkholderiales bacterium]|nr:bifunctional demethylmenaquinone methyltransferase/2-methoxy-6-polyprenyl-1,4-benzoquinol methylase UbiE [Burkholderiales bacterium]